MFKGQTNIHLSVLIYNIKHFYQLINVKLFQNTITRFVILIDNTNSVFNTFKKI